LGLMSLWRYRCTLYYDKLNNMLSIFFASTFEITSIFDILVISNQLIPFSDIVLFSYFRTQAFDRWTLISPCLPRGYVF
jgi:hypothetical protein